MAQFIAAIGLVLVIEGLLFAAFPRFAKRLAASALESPETSLRVAGIAIILLTIVTCLYTAVGGIKAVIWTDVIQACLMFGGALVAIGTLLGVINGVLIDRLQIPAFIATFSTQGVALAIPLILTGLSATVAFKARLFNIGAEGQLFAGALAAVAVGGMHGGTGFELPVWLLFPLMMLAAAIAGALLLLGPALMKNKLGVDEVVTMLLINFIVLLGV